MTNSRIFSKDKDDAGPFVTTDVLVKLKGCAFTFRKEPAGYIPDPDFVPFIWRRKGDDVDDESGAKEKDDVVETSEHTRNPSNHPSPSSAPANKIHETQVQQRVLSSVVSRDVTGCGSVLLAQESASPSTPRAIVVSQPSSPSRTATSSPAALQSVRITGGSAGSPDSSPAEVAPQPPPSTRTAPWQTAVSKPVQAAGVSAGRAIAPSTSRHPAARVGPTQLAPQLEPCMHASSVLGHKGLASGMQPCNTTHSTVIRSSSEPDAPVAAQQFLMKPKVCVLPMDAPPVVLPPDTPSSAAVLSLSVVVTAGEGDATTPSSPPPVEVPTRLSSSEVTPTCHIARHAVADDGTADTDEDSLAKAMRRKAVQNLDNQGNNENDISVSTNALRHLEYDRLKVTP
nr:mucin-5AC-like [Aegilops tauschii subsp. strangulata]